MKQGSDEAIALAWHVTRLDTVRVLFHDGFAVGQAASLLLVPSQRLAVAVLTNLVRGGAFNREVKRAVAREYLGITVTDPAPMHPSPAELAEYAGRYSLPFMDVVVSVAADRLIQQIQKQGFPRRTAPTPPPAPAAPYRLYVKDRIMGAGPAEGERMEFIRRPDGTIGWLRTNGRIAARAPVP